MANLALTFKVPCRCDRTAALKPGVALARFRRTLGFQRFRPRFWGRASKTLRERIRAPYCNSSWEHGSAQDASEGAGTDIIALRPQQLNRQFTNYFSDDPCQPALGQQQRPANSASAVHGTAACQPAWQHARLACASFPNVATSMLYPNGVTGTPSHRRLTSQFGTMASKCAIRPRHCTGQRSLALQRLFQRRLAASVAIFGSGTGTNTDQPRVGTTKPSVRSMGVDTSAIASASNTSFSSLLSPIDSFLGLQSSSSISRLPTTGLTSLFAPIYRKQFQ